MMANVKGGDMLFFNLFFLVMIFCANCSLAADGCGSTVFGDGGYSVRCGDECTGGEGFCTCGEGAKKFNHLLKKHYKNPPPS